MTTWCRRLAVVWLLNAVGGLACAGDGALPGVRHALKGADDDAAYCSLLAPVTWQLEHGRDDATHRDRFMFRPPTAAYPYLMVDAWRTDDSELHRERKLAEQLPQHALLDSDAPGRSFDSGRSAVWEIARSDRLLRIRVHLLRNPMLILQFAGTPPVDPAEQRTLLKVIDTIDFDAAAANAVAAATPGPKSTAINQPKFLLLTESESPSGGVRGYWIAGLVFAVVLTLVVVERKLRQRDEAQRIREAEESALERQKLQQELDAWTPNPRHPKPKRKLKPKPE